MKSSVVIIISFFALTACNCLNKKSSYIQNSNDLIKNRDNIQYSSLFSFKGDSLVYIKENFLEKKEQYIGKEFSVFLDHLEIPIKRYTTAIGYPPNSNYSHISIQFYKYEERESLIKKKKNPMILTITWENPISPEAIEPVMIKSQSNWTPEVDAFFRKQKIKNIQMVDYGF
jgi:hypothetical protein